MRFACISALSAADRAQLAQRQDMNVIAKTQHQENGSHAQTESVELTILMPCLNEAKTIGGCIAKAKGFLERERISGEVLIADNGSTDGSIAIAGEAGARVVAIAERGYGAALIGGIEAARGEYVIMGDADASYDFENLEGFVERLRAGDDLVVGNRFQGGISQGAMPALHRYLGNPVLSLFGRMFFKIPVGDFHCGLRGFRRDTIQALDLQTAGMEFASEMVVRSGLEKLRISEVPTTLRPDGRGRAPHLRTWRDGWRHLKFLLMYSPRWLYLVPGLLLMMAGVLLTLLLAAGPLTLPGGVTLDLNSFIAGCVIAVIGHQMISFGLIARYYASISGMLPADAHSDSILALCKTDRLLIAALLLILAGAGIFSTALVIWAQTGFGELTSPLPTRLAVAGLSVIVIGFQTAFSAFLFGIFDIPVRRGAAEEPAQESKSSKS
jgi:glycosyltransferase involved in cell wall biosynthesis